MTSYARIEVLGAVDGRFDEILTPEALRFLTRLHDQFAGRRHERLAARMHQRAAIDNGRDLKFLSETAAVREEPSWLSRAPAPGWKTGESRSPGRRIAR